jgi:hypothetical protein
MRVANAHYALRVIFDEIEELESIVGKKDASAERPVIYVQFNPNAPTRFLMLSKHELPGSFAMGAVKERPTDTFATQLILSGKRYSRSSLPFFAPEPVMLKSSNDHKGTIIEVVRPPMQRAPQYRSPSAKTLARLDRAKEAALQASSPHVSALPRIPPQVPIEAMDEASAVMTLKAAIATINAAKDRNGEQMMMTITKYGKLRVLVAYGEDADPEGGDGQLSGKTG